MEISFSDQNDAEIAARREKLLARLTKRKAATEVTNSSKNSAKELDYLIQKATQEVEAKTICPGTIENLERLLPSSTGRILKRIQDTLEELRKIQLAQSKSQKAGGFSFVKKSPATVSSPIATEEPENTTTSENVLAPICADNVLEIFDKENSDEEVSGEDGTSVSLKNLKNCSLRFAFSPSAVHLKNIESCDLKFPEIESSILMHEVKRSKIFAVAQQIRMHDSTDTELHVSVRGAVILEGCRNIGMAPYRLTLNGTPICSFDSEQWKKPLDFDWLSSEQSPNWHIIKEELWRPVELL